MATNKRIADLDYKIIMHLSRRELHTLTALLPYLGNIESLLEGWEDEVKKKAGANWRENLRTFFSEVHALSKEEQEFLKKVTTDAKAN